EQILKNVKSRNTAQIRIFCFGIGHDVNSMFLDRLAEDNFGARDYVTPEENIEIKVSSFNDKISHPVLTNVMLEIPGIDTYDRYPMQLPDLFKGSQLVLYGRYRSTGPAAVRLSGKVGDQQRGFQYDAKFPASESAHDFIPRQWAMAKIGYLLTQIRLHGEKDELKQEVVRLAKEHGVITPYTSYLVLEDIAVRPAQPGFGGLRRELEDSGGRLRAGADALHESKSSGEAVEAGRALDKMKGDAAPGAAQYGGKDEEVMVLDNVRHMIRNIGSKTFYSDNNVWYDSSYKKGDTTTQVKYMSDRYFELLGEKPELGKYFALGKHVVVVLDGTAYEVTE
ncbi:MAG: hypothetical protein RDV41_14090, partial [Planctomycetota bacterium]|nr:hypothetical protein [Planctomycetota bacterium]